jgi:hypothetical protein
MFRRRETTRPSVVRGFSRREQETYRRTLEAARYARERNVSLTVAAKKHGTTVATMRSYLGDSLTKSKNRYRVSEKDRLVRKMLVITPSGPETVYVKGRSKAALAAKHLATSIAYAEGKVGPEAFYKFEGKMVAGRYLNVDPDSVLYIVDANQIDYDDLYPDGRK